MMPITSKPVRRLAALAILALLILAAWQIIVGPVVTRLADVHERIETERTLLGRLLAAEKELAGAARPSQTVATTAPAVHLQGASEAIALAGLQANVTAVAAGHGVRPQTTRMLMSIEREEMRFAGVHIEIAATIDVVQRILHTMETARPVLFVEQLTLEPVTALAMASGAEPGQMRAVIQVYAALPRKKE